MNFRDFPNYDWWRNSEQVRTDQRVATHISVSSRHRDDERIRIEILIRSTLDDVSGKGRIQGRAHRISAIAIVRRVVAELRGERKSGLNGLNSSERPAAYQFLLPSAEIRQERLPPANGKFVGGIDPRLRCGHQCSRDPNPVLDFGARENLPTAALQN